MTLRIEHQSKLRTALFVNSSDMLPSGGVSTLHLVHDNHCYIHLVQLHSHQRRSLIACFIDC